MTCDYCFEKTFVLKENDEGKLVGGPPCKKCNWRKNIDEPDCIACRDTGYSYLSEDLYAGCNYCDSSHGGYAKVCNKCDQTFPVEGGFMTASTKGCPRCPPKQLKFIEEFEGHFRVKLPTELRDQLVNWVKDQTFFVDSYMFEN